MEKNSTPAICKMGCGFFGNYSLEGMCSKCHKESVQHQFSATSVTEATSGSSVTCEQNKSKQATTNKDDTVKHNLNEVGISAEVHTIPVISATSALEETCASPQDETSPTEADSPSSSKKRIRCYSCRKKVGLTGMKCRCGEIFCGLHRYSDKHNCTFDYKTDGRKRLAKENPVIIGEKIKKI